MGRRNLYTYASNNKHLKERKRCCRRKMQDNDVVYALSLCVRVNVGPHARHELNLGGSPFTLSGGKACRHGNHEPQPYDNPPSHLLLVPCATLISLSQCQVLPLIQNSRAACKSPMLARIPYHTC